MTRSLPLQPPFRCGTAASQSRTAELLNLPKPEPHDQDWEICSADPARVRQFLTVYQSEPSLIEDEKFTLMELIVASFDELLQAGPNNDDLQDAICEAIFADFELHAYTVYYWCQWNRGDNPPAEEQFAVTPFMRRVLCSRTEAG
jgi:hypothetical protein